ncbi:hypothetical protein BDV25DRAFT_162017 [Aspergillus avenaceus]|uniref:Uncharacterized protein n=1 Tax=Aspergillus avenaceus TaxID=36643 RepID=A0A5N6TKM6_ASPAV|nr:hypothetical protein BDV25DRAFT_162017 [Aspergillus avenaceus]
MLSCWIKAVKNPFATAAIAALFMRDKASSVVDQFEKENQEQGTSSFKDAMKPRKCDDPSAHCKTPRCLKEINAIL